MKKVDFLQTLNKAAAYGRKYIAVGVLLPNCKLPEIIINHADNITQKAVYYGNAYDDDMRLIANSSIKIVSVYAGEHIDKHLSEIYDKARDINEQRNINR